MALERNVLANRAEVIAPMKTTGWLNAGENFHGEVRSPED
jgi:hypothetical protein